MSAIVVVGVTAIDSTIASVAEPFHGPFRGPISFRVSIPLEGSTAVTTPE
jgi:hypothetical protein